MKRINVIIDYLETKKALKKADNEAGVKSISALFRYLVKKFLGEKVL